MGDPSLRLKNGCAQDDAGQKPNCTTTLLFFVTCEGIPSSHESKAPASGG
jgi:hypothetical protein